MTDVQQSKWHALTADEAIIQLETTRDGLSQEQQCSQNRCTDVQAPEAQIPQDLRPCSQGQQHQSRHSNASPVVGLPEGG